MEIFGLILLAGLLFHIFHHGIVHTFHRAIHLALALALIALGGFWYITTEPARGLEEAMHTQRIDAANWNEFVQEVGWVWEAGPRSQVYAQRYRVALNIPVVRWGLKRFALEHEVGYEGLRHNWSDLARVMRPLSERG